MKINIEHNTNFDFEDAAVTLCALLLPNRSVGFNSVITGGLEPENDVFYVYLYSSNKQEMGTRSSNGKIDVTADEQRINELRRNGYLAASFDLAEWTISDVKNSVESIATSIEQQDFSSRTQRKLKARIEGNTITIYDEELLDRVKAFLREELD